MSYSWQGDCGDSRPGQRMGPALQLLESMRPRGPLDPLNEGLPPSHPDSVLPLFLQMRKQAQFTWEQNEPT